MRKSNLIYILSIVIVCSCSINTQKNEEIKKEQADSTEIKTIKAGQFVLQYQMVDENYRIIEDATIELPKFPGGYDSLAKFIIANVNYPETAINNKIEGTVFIEFIVNKKGKVENVKLKKGVRDDLNKAAIDVIELLPDWLPAKDVVNNQYHSVLFNIPLKFKK